MRFLVPLIAALALLALAAAPTRLLSAPPSKPALRQVVRITLAPDPSRRPAGSQTAEETAHIARVLSRRADALGLSRVTVTPAAQGQITVEMPASLAKEPTLRQLTRRALLEFRWLKNIKTLQHPRARYEIALRPRRSAAERDTYTFRDARTGQSVRAAQVLGESAVILSGDALKPSVREDHLPERNEIVLTFELDRDGTAALADFTRTHIGELLAVVFDGEILTAPSIRDPIESGKGVLQGRFRSVTEAQTMARLLNSGALPVPLKIVRTEPLPARE